MYTKPHQDILCWHYSAEQLQDPELVCRLVQRISVACDLRGTSSDLQLVVVELMNNALDHGVLKLESSMKAEANGFTRYYNERERRLADLRSGWIEVSIEVTDSKTLCVRVLDSGNGFDYRAWRLDRQTGDTTGHERSTVNELIASADGGDRLDNLNAVNTFGRGLNILNELCTTLAHVGCGNEVVVELEMDSLLRPSSKSAPALQSEVESRNLGSGTALPHF